MSLCRTLRNRRGFTLAEVMTTCTLIASLGGGGAFVNTTNQAQQQVCLQHLNAIGQALVLRDTLGEPLPDAAFFPKKGQEAKTLTALLAAQVPAQTFLCPAAPASLREYKITYIYNSKLAGKALSQVPSPSATWVVTDINLVDPALPAAHTGGANVLFADGRAKWVAQAQLPKLR